MNLRIEGMTARKGTTRFRFDADVRAGITGITGPSGAGKTTLLRLIAGIAAPAAGRMTFNGRVLFDGGRTRVPAEKRNIGMVFQGNYLFPHLSVRANLRYGRRAGGTKSVDEDELAGILDIVPLLDRMPHELSGGEQQRVALGRALAASPDLLLLDEPFANLDAARRRKVISCLLETHRRTGVPLLVVSHDRDDLQRLARTLLVVDKGRILDAGTPAAIAERGRVPDIIAHRDRLNVIELFHAGYDPGRRQYRYAVRADGGGGVFVTGGSGYPDPPAPGTMVRFAVYPDDIGLADGPVPATSIGNQLPGRVVGVSSEGASCFVTLDCGVALTAEITTASAEKLRVRTGRTFTFLVKARAVVPVHEYRDAAVSARTGAVTEPNRFRHTA